MALQDIQKAHAQLTSQIKALEASKKYYEDASRKQTGEINNNKKVIEKLQTDLIQTQKERSDL